MASELHCCFFYFCSFIWQHWVANNLFGLAFALNGVELLHLNNVSTGCILLGGLFVYDVFWVSLAALYRSEEKIADFLFIVCERYLDVVCCFVKLEDFYFQRIFGCFCFYQTSVFIISRFLVLMSW